MAGRLYASVQQANGKQLSDKERAAIHNPMPMPGMPKSMPMMKPTKAPASTPMSAKMAKLRAMRGK